ncbi:MAG: inositol monophosphatase family protein [Acidimicrobiia bacterium]
MNVAPGELRAVAVEAIREAGAILRAAFAVPQVVSHKGPEGLVTAADLDSEHKLVHIIRDTFPDHGIRSEEAGEVAQGADYTWFLDPLDGTDNFVRGIPYFGVAVSLVHDGRVTLSAVYQPVRDELYQAERNGGVVVNETPIRSAGEEKLEDAVIAFDHGYRLGKAAPAAAELRASLSEQARRGLWNWAPTLDWGLLARGAIDGMVAVGSVPEERHAGALLAAEAGAIVTNFRGEPFGLEDENLLAAASLSLHEALLELAAKAGL